MAVDPFYIKIQVAHEGRTPLGRFPPGINNAFREQMAAANKQLAREMQSYAVEEVEKLVDRSPRKQVSTGRLRAVTGDSRNATWGDSHYGVGVVDFLDKSIARYWRQIEEGFEGHVGRELYGFWGGSITRVVNGPDGSRTYAGKPWHRHSPRRSDMFIPATGRFRQEGKFARYGADDEEGGRNVPNFAKRTTIKNPIMGQRYYATAKQRFNPGQRSVDEVMRVLRMTSEAAWHRTARNNGWIRES